MDAARMISKAETVPVDCGAHGRGFEARHQLGVEARHQLDAPGWQFAGRKPPSL